MSRIENNAAMLVVKKFKLLMDINEWIAHVQYKNFSAPPKTIYIYIGLCKGMCDE